MYSDEDSDTDEGVPSLVESAVMKSSVFSKLNKTEMEDIMEEDKMEIQNLGAQIEKLEKKLEIQKKCYESRTAELIQIKQWAQHVNETTHRHMIQTNETAAIFFEKLSLIAELEDAFEISMEMDDIIDFSSYKKGFELIAKYEIEF